MDLQHLTQPGFNRRKFLKYSSLFAASSLVAPGLQMGAAAQTSARKKRMVVVLLRGAMDGLNVVVPYRDENYYQSRPTISIAPPGKPNGLIDLDGQFGLNPALSDLMPLWQSRRFAIIHASGSPAETRSHFDAQDYMETGTPGYKATSDGWMNRLLGLLPRISSTQAVSLSNTTPRILSGSLPSSNVAPGTRGVTQMAIDREPIQQVFDQLYAGNDLLASTYKEGRRSRELIKSGLMKERMDASRGAPSPGVFPRSIQNIVKLMTGPTNTQLLVLSLGGWDTHVNQGSSTGLLTRQLKPLGEGLSMLYRALGASFQDTTIVVMSEFGRTVKENGNGGTDHGHGNVMFVLGGNIAGGQVYGDWNGLHADALNQGRDLPVNTDFREVLSPLISSHFSLSPNAMGQVFPNYQPQNPIALL